MSTKERANHFTDEFCLGLHFDNHFDKSRLKQTYINELSINLKCGVRRFVERVDEFYDGSFTLIQGRKPLNLTFFEEDGYRSPIYSIAGWDLSDMRSNLRQRIREDDTSEQSITPVYGICFIPGIVRRLQVFLPPMIEPKCRHTPYPSFPWGSIKDFSLRFDVCGRVGTYRTSCQEPN